MDSAAASKIVWTPAASSNIKATSYNEATEKVGVEFHNGGFYGYEDVDVNIYTGMVHADSIGKYLNSVIKGMYHYSQFSSKEELEQYMLHNR